MASPHKFYLAHIHEQSGFRATWDPSRVLKIGYVGKLDKFGVFTVFTSLEDEGIVPVIGPKPTKLDMDYTSHDSVTIANKVAGSAPVAGSALTDLDAGFTIDFKNEEGVVFQTIGQRTFEIVNMKEIEQQILKKFRNDNWEQNWQVITHVVKTDTATIIISNSAGGKVELKAKAGIGAPNLKLADASLGLTTALEKGSTMKFISQSGLTPLYRIMGLYQPFFGDWQLKGKGEGGENLSIQEFTKQELENDD